MPTDQLPNGSVKWLTFLVYILLGVLTILTGWHTQAISVLPDKYVRLERYNSDMDRVETALWGMDAKLDRLLERSKMNENH